MLVELGIENLLLIERARLSLGEGLNVITGETGAGKTVLAHAIDLLLGGKARRGIVRPGKAEAYVEGVFDVSGPLESWEDPPKWMLECEGGEIVLARRISGDGRTRAYVQHRSAGARDLQEIGSKLLLFYGQHEHRKLMMAGAQLGIVDSFCGSVHLELLARYRSRYGRLLELEQERERLKELAGRRDRDLELLRHELDEIDRADPDPSVEADMESERRRLAHAEELRVDAASAAELLDPDVAESSGALELLRRAGVEAAKIAEIDADAVELSDRLTALVYECEDVAHELRAYESRLESDPEGLARIETRLDLFARLKMKHGGTLESVIEYGRRIRGEVERMEGAGEEVARVEQACARALDSVRSLAGELSGARRQAAKDLAISVTASIAKLGMKGAEFEVRVAPGAATDDPAPGPLGIDSVEFFARTNPGLPAAPVRETASGGELSRLMLAILGASQVEHGAATVVFDEIDAGIGGTTARAVGEKLRALAHATDGRQVLCITHLPQIASLADRHFRIEKRDAGDARVTFVESLEGEEVVAELCRMLGADVADAGARQHARELLSAA